MKRCRHARSWGCLRLNRWGCQQYGAATAQYISCNSSLPQVEQVKSPAPQLEYGWNALSDRAGMTLGAQEGSVVILLVCTQPES